MDILGWALCQHQVAFLFWWHGVTMWCFTAKIFWIPTKRPRCSRAPQCSGIFIAKFWWRVIPSWINEVPTCLHQWWKNAGIIRPLPEGGLFVFERFWFFFFSFSFLFSLRCLKLGSAHRWVIGLKGGAVNFCLQKSMPIGRIGIFYIRFETEFSSSDVLGN